MSFFNLEKINDGKFIKFNIKNMDIAFVNSIRRIILSEIPNVGFNFDIHNITNSDIIINKNTCALHNEFLAHRISLIPIFIDDSEIVNFNPKKYKFIIKKKNNTANIINITTQDFEIYDENNKKYPDSIREYLFPKNPITNDYILITKIKPNLYDLQNGEEIDIEAFASKDIAKTHSRWCPVSQCSFGNVIDIESANEAFLIKVSKTESETGKKLTEEKIQSMRQQFNTLDAYRYYIKNMYDEPSEVEFMIETECRLTPQYIFGQSIDILKNKLLQFIEKLDKDIQIQPIPNVENFFELYIKDESYTLLNVLQSLIYNFNLRQTESSILEFIGYYSSHPLDNVMILKIKFVKFLKEKDTIQFLKNFLEENVKKIIEQLENYHTEWNEFIQ